jgi:putative alpha-1,2-mannosidase
MNHTMQRVFQFMLLVIAAAILNGCSSDMEPASLHQTVNPFIGTGGHGHTYPGATVPFGMVQLSPDTRLDGWDGCGGYHYSDSMIYGFTHTHLQGTGVSDYGDILFMPCTQYRSGAANWADRYKSRFDHAQESAHAGYYSVQLQDHGILAELTATERVGVHR